MIPERRPLARSAAADARRSPVYLTAQDEYDWGGDLIEFSQRVAAHALAPTLQQMERTNAELRERLAREAKRNLDQAVEGSPTAAK